ncbi:MAG: hypothetical protein IK051_02085 [Rhodocyclaceae bacterium]|nr:hypothetical protein [Rhodocyclaceae bacterium]
MELTLTADGQCVLDRNIMASIGALPGGKVEVSRQQDGSVRIAAAGKKLSIHEVRHKMRAILGDVHIADAPLEEIQASIASAYAEHGQRGLQ